MSTSTYETYALRYAFRDDNTASSTFYRYELYGEAEKPYPMDYFFWVARNSDRTVLVDCGYTPQRAEQRGRTLTATPAELLGRIGLSPAEVDHVVLSHMHWDHIGNVGLFPNATFSIARREFEFWRGPFAHRPCLGLALGDEELTAVENLEREGRLFQVEDDHHELYPGIRLITSPGHTPGQLVTDVSTPDGSVVLASDALHYADEMTLDRPFHVFTELEGMYRTYQLLRSLAARPDTTVVAGHDPAVTAGYKEVAENCLDLSAPVGAR
ncbi:N-acyl homoserine lactonase family protein [Amycolatopsis rubida]|uniref:N-acyl homoserine lactonase family protein n=1 Tax=Amycolatopsis rubida TaxID=112413 RepID=A0ABX0C714_9PSEU|nr:MULTISPECIES: N-acyl homoserine lactonase family protein [Amycolatopsis]MYW96226.1 MBL fold metallo-hydrolase [Amycolatopsis rubida]NEC61217.1 N-acyl homoserine lactonase family protein [Amycolatopsis rubida]OAP24257.1 N-acyl homoserine lactonase AttM [Amycolatopsis sp. M39]